MKKWEHKVLHYDANKVFSSRSFCAQEFQKQLSYLGWEGWELVDTMEVKKNGYTREIVATLKRELTPAREKEFMAQQNL